jgi:hypothetical protein
MQLYSQQNSADFNRVLTRFKQNFQGFCGEHAWYIILLLAAAFLDCLSTISFMLVIGPEREIHPLIRELALMLGPISGPMVGKFLQVSVGMLAVVYLRKQASYIMVLTAIMYGWAAVANFLISIF